MMHLFIKPMATAYHKLSGFQQQKCAISEFWGQEVWNQQRHPPLETNNGRNPSLFLPSSGVFLAIFHVSWLPDGPWKEHENPPFLYSYLSSVCACLCGQIPNFSLIRIYAILDKGSPKDLILTWLPLWRPYFQMRIHSEVLGVRMSTSFFRIHNSIHNTWVLVFSNVVSRQTTYWASQSFKDEANFFFFFGK